MHIEKFSLWLKQLQQVSKQKGWRNLVVLAGESIWQNKMLDAAIATLTIADDSVLAIKETKGLIYSKLESVNNLSQHKCFTLVNRKNAAKQLGTEQDVVIFNVGSNTNDFDVNAFAALSGTIVAGGTLFLLVNAVAITESSKQANELYKDYFFQRFTRLLKSFNTGSIYLFQQNGNNQYYQADDVLFANQQEIGNTSSLDLSTEFLSYGCITHEQVKAVDSILKVLKGHRNRPLVLTADRGRGKSSSLAIAVCHLLINGSADQQINIILTAPNRQSVTVIFQYLAKHLLTVDISANKVSHANGSLVFLPIDQVLQQDTTASLLLIDEAAGFPIYLLEQLLNRYHRLVFSSTVHGYEGAGRGFSLKFQTLLNKKMPQWRQLHINEPIRWASDDPLEAFVFKSCLLNAQLKTQLNEQLPTQLTPTLLPTLADQSNSDVETLRVRLLTPQQLIDDELLIEQVFSVLVTAHYQTSPSDLQLLLNNEAVSVYVLMNSQNNLNNPSNAQPQVLGVVMVIREGQMASDLVAQVKANTRRMRDQFIPQSLLTHCGIKDSFDYRYQRVIRIAIHPQMQRQGLGRYLLNKVEQKLQQQGADFIGTSFAGNASLLMFWQKNGFSLARIGFNKDKASGEHSCLMIKAIDNHVSIKQDVISQRFYQQFDYWLTDEFSALPALMVWQILHHNHVVNMNSNYIDLNNTEFYQSVNDFVGEQRQYSSCVYDLHQWLLQHCLADFNSEVLPLIARILQKHSVKQVCSDYGFTGKKALNQHFINYIRKCLK